MKFHKTDIAGAYLIEEEPRVDERGSFAREFCVEELQAADIMIPSIVQINNSYNKKTRTLRGMHYQAAPWDEIKIVKVARGAIWDNIIDLRPDSPTYKKTFGTLLQDSGPFLLYVPPLCAHGFITLQDDTNVLYFLDNFYDKSSERAVRYNDPTFNLEWPITPLIISERDRTLPDWKEP